METIVLCLMFGAFIFASFYFGFKLGNKGEIKAEEPKTLVNKITTKLKKEEDNTEEEELWKVINNIENYNGTSEGQEVIE